MHHGHGTAGLGENIVEPDGFCRVFFGRFWGALKKQPSVLVTDCESLYGAIHKGGGDPSSTDKRLAIKLAVVKSRTTEGEADVSLIDALCQITACLTKHASRKSEEVSQQVINQAQRLIKGSDAGNTTGREREGGRGRPRRSGSHLRRKMLRQL